MASRIRRKPKTAQHVGPSPQPPERRDGAEAWSGSQWFTETLLPASRVALERRPKLRMEGR